MKKNIFTFWEPKDKIPPYIKLCMKTWEKYLPDYKIIVLDYENLHGYLPQKIIEKIIYKKMPLMLQSDCIRAWVLYLHGGFWLDADTIIKDNNILTKAEKQDFCMIGRHLAFLYAKKRSLIVKEWAKEIPKHVLIYKFRHICKFFIKGGLQTIKKWDYFGNSILNPVVDKSDKKNMLIFKISDLYSDLECIGGERSKSRHQKYLDFYFKDNDYREVLAKNRGIILLHNSWTPQEIKDMDWEEFLCSNITLSKMLREILDI